MRVMTLDDFFKQPGAPSMSAFALRCEFHEGQIRQWRHGYAGALGKPRVPSPENCVVIERATGGVVTRQDLRPADWERIWPELSAEKPGKRGRKLGAQAAAA
jgi:DNA-binding transcriptional regulator YdaS (Cro superfamily)